MSDPRTRDIERRVKEEYRMTVVPQYHQMAEDIKYLLRENERLAASNMNMIRAGLAEIGKGKKK